MKTVELRGIIPPILTPMNPDESVNLEVLRQQIERMIAGGVHGLFVFGTSRHNLYVKVTLLWLFMSYKFPLCRIPLSTTVYMAQSHHRISLSTPRGSSPFEANRSHFQC